MDTDVIKAKLVSLQRCMQRIRHKTPSSAQHLAADFDLQDILILNLQRAVQISTDIATTILAESSSVPSTMAEAFLLLHRQGVLSESVAHKLAKSVGLRNIAVHEYTALTGTWSTPWRIRTLKTLRNLAARSALGLRRGPNIASHYL